MVNLDQVPESLKHIKCHIYVTRVYYPKREVIPGDWASFQAEIDNVIEGETLSQAHGRDDHLLICGKVPSLVFGRPYYIEANLKKHPKFGNQYELVRMEMIREFTDPLSQRKFLERILSESKVNRLYEHLDQPYTAIQKGNVAALCSVPGFGKATALQLITKFRDSFAVGGAYAELANYDLTSTMLDKLIAQYGSADTLLHHLKENPYRLINDVDGIGWSKADLMAQASGIAEDSDVRISAAISHQLRQYADAGDTWITAGELAYGVKSLLGLESVDDKIRECMYQLYDQGVIYWPEDKSYVGLTRLRDLEQQIAHELKRLMSATPNDLHNSSDCTEIIREIEQEQGWHFVDEQIDAIRLTRQSPVSIITGVAGSGKSSVVYGVLQSLGEYEVAQTALSGRAASRLGELTKSSGMTIHRLLQVDPNTGSFACNKDNPVDFDIIVLDEVSMVGAELFLSLLQAIPTGSKLIMLGDDGQLESIGLCNIFKDMLDSQIIPVCKLTKIHRQAQRSAIKTEALKVRKSQQLIPGKWIGEETRGELQDLTLSIYDDRILSQKRILDTYKRWIDKGIDPKDIQIVVPMRARGDISARSLSIEIQSIINPRKSDSREISITSKEGETGYNMRIGDLVIATVNNYKTTTVDGQVCPIYNGNRGVICSIDLQAEEMIVNFDQWGLISIPKRLWNTIDLAYALTCHKLQGSEAPYVIVGVDYSAFALLTKEWLYTAITRARTHCTICAESDALRYCVKNTNIPYKRTRLQEFLRDNT